MMRGILRRRPSPAMIVALAALGIALGGVAFATIPDSSGTIHGCYQKASGKLRVVEVASDCRTNESAISWNQEGPPGAPAGGVLARLRGGPVDVITRTPGQVVTKDIALSPTNTWAQAPREFQELQVSTQVQKTELCDMLVTVYLDGEQLKSIYISDQIVRFRDLDQLSFDHPLFEPGEQRTHTLRAVVTSDRGTFCGTFDGGVLESMKVDVLGFR